jgi:hypothetical protein
MKTSCLGSQSNKTEILQCHVCSQWLMIFLFLTVGVLQGQPYLYHYQQTISIGSDVRNFTLAYSQAENNYLVSEGFVDIASGLYPYGLALIRLSDNLNVNWVINHRPNDPDWSNFKVEDVLECQSGEIVICGSASSKLSRTERAFISKFTPGGQMLWFRYYWPCITFKSLVENSNGSGFIACGSARENMVTNGAIVSVDDQGALVWMYYVPPQMAQTSTGYEEIIHAGTDLLAVGHINLTQSTSNPYSSDVLLSRFEADGTLVYHRVMSYGSDSVFSLSLMPKSLIYDGDSAVYITGGIVGDSLTFDTMYPFGVNGRFRLFHDVFVIEASFDTGCPWWRYRYNTGEQWYFDQYTNDEWGEKIILWEDTLMVCGHSITYHQYNNPNRDGFLLPLLKSGVPMQHTHFGDTLTDYLYDMYAEVDTMVMAGYSNNNEPSRYDLYLVERFPYVNDTCLFYTHITPYFWFPLLCDSTYWVNLDVADYPLEFSIHEPERSQYIMCDKKKSQITPRKGLDQVIPVNIYPNPAQDQLFIEGGGGSAKQVFLYTMYGKQVAQQTIGAGEPMQLGNLPAGLYTLRVFLQDGSTSSFIIIIQ